MDSTDLKISRLRAAFPEIKEDAVLLEILLSCNGSLKQTETILLEQFSNDPVKKRKLQESSSSKYQSSIKGYIQGNKRKHTGAVLNKLNTKTVVLHDKEDIESTLPYVSFHKNFLPPDIANSILKFLITQKDLLLPKTFYLYGKKCESHHSSGTFTSTDSTVKGSENLMYNAEKINSTADYSDEMRIMQMLVEDKVRQLLQERPQLSPFQSQEWVGNLAVCNLFENRTNNLEWHSDRLTHTGPLPVIASISFGATREFKLRKNFPVKANPHPIYSIPLPHNTLLIMHSGCQEEYKHGVMTSSTPIEPHPISGQMRFNLTMRHFVNKFCENVPLCKCEMPMILRRSYKEVSGRGKYFWQCQNVYQNAECGLFHWAQFDNKSLIADDERDCSVWIADDDDEKWQYMRDNGIQYDKDMGVFKYNL